MPASSPEQLSALFSQAIAQGDLEAVMALYEPGAAFHAQSGEVRSGIDAIRQEMAPFAAMKPDLKIDVNKVITAAGGDIALMYNTASMTNPQVSIRAIEVARKQPDGTWLYVIDDPGTLGPA